jgi:di/tricarboxylate transporter
VGPGRRSRAAARQHLDSPGILTAVVVAASFGLAPVELIAFTGAVLGAIVVQSGLAAVLARSIEQVSSGSMAIVVVVFALTTTVMTNLITNAAAASILTPVAIGIATRLGLNPVTLLALVATCISFTFINPLSKHGHHLIPGIGDIG